jgi:ribosomal protein S18 acetylase RimI-like enzyme
MLSEEIPEFTQEEVAVAQEVFDAALADPEASGYAALVDEASGKVAGFLCYGPTPMTQGTFDLYWLGVARSARGQGIGRRLVEHAEQRMARAGGRLVRVETAGLSAYAPTRRFYEQAGYLRAATIPSFYAPDNDLCVYVKYLSRGPTPA